jgi:glycosyltransferase involved in cell wall biosynthesis
MHINTDPIISIAIPTYNRAKNLKLTLDSIITQEIFIKTNKFEIVISDNCSKDNTTEIVKHYIALFPDKIKYHRNVFNNVDLNFETVLKKCSGQYLKLNNDTLVHEPYSLKVMLSTVEKYINTKPIILFTTSAAKTKHIIFNDINEFLTNVSYLNTWIACFGIWKSDLENLQDFSRNVNLNLVQTDVICRLINSGKIICINNDYIFKTIESPKKGGYHLVQVFLVNYSKILHQYVENKLLDKKIFDAEIKKILCTHILFGLANTYISPNKFTFDKQNSFNIINNYFKKNLLFLSYFYCKYILYYIYRVIKIFLIQFFKIVSKPFNKTKNEISIHL